MNSQMRTFTELIDLRMKQERSVIVDDIRPLVTDCTVDIICETAMGIKVNAQKLSMSPNENSTEKLYLKALKDLFDLILKRIMTPWHAADFIYKLSKDGKRFFECVEHLHKFSNHVIQKRKKELEDSVDLRMSLEDSIEKMSTTRSRLAFLDLLLMYHLKDPDQFNVDSVREEVDTFMFGGHDTTSSALHFAFMLIGLNPDKQVCTIRFYNFYFCYICKT